mmetsp:Transcript_7198/g.15562  ORF Transcript_7198/g.15562 Transcript_7198/m.15562 type:complete len:132 (+) Transcript_7198:261-656(+)
MGNTSKNTADAQKAYKKAKKRRRQLRKAEQLKAGNKNNTGQQSSSSSSSSNAKPKWHRVGKEDGAKKAVDRPLEKGYGVDQINELLEKRSKAKEIKDYAVSDEITKTLVKLQIVYDDDKRAWHTREWKYGV